MLLLQTSFTKLREVCCCYIPYSVQTCIWSNVSAGFVGIVFDFFFGGGEIQRYSCALHCSL